MLCTRAQNCHSVNWEKKRRPSLEEFCNICICQVAKHYLNDHSTANLPLTVWKTQHQNCPEKPCKIPDMDETKKLEDSPLTQEGDDEERRNAHTIVGRSLFTHIQEGLTETV